MSKKSIILMLSLVFSLLACQEEKVQEDAISVLKRVEVTEKFEVTPELKTYLNSTYVPYLKLADDLANDDFESAKNSLSQFEVANLEAPENFKGSKLYAKVLTSIQNLKAANDLSAFREVFKSFSNEYISNLFEYKTSLDKELKVFYCAMSKGRWAQEQSEIKNPFHGSEMLRCGGEEK